MNQWGLVFASCRQTTKPLLVTKDPVGVFVSCPEAEFVQVPGIDLSAGGTIENDELAKSIGGVQRPCLPL